jgi:hypothetical protein
MSQESQDGAFEKRTRAVLEESAARLDGRTLSAHAGAARGARAAAASGARPLVGLDAGRAPRRWPPAVSLWMGRPPLKRPVPWRTEFLTDADAPEFVTDGEELEFYEWAAGEMES